VKQTEYKSFGIGSDASTIVPIFKDLLREVLGDKMDEEFKDFELSKEQTKEIRAIFDKKIDDTLPDREFKNPPNIILEWKGEAYGLSLSLICPNNRKIRDFHWIVTICDECLSENKPMFISVESDKE
jgi:hypothetical protein